MDFNFWVVEIIRVGLTLKREIFLKGNEENKRPLVFFEKSNHLYFNVCFASYSCREQQIQMTVLPFMTHLAVPAPQ